VYRHTIGRRRVLKAPPGRIWAAMDRRLVSAGMNARITGPNMGRAWYRPKHKKSGRLLLAAADLFVYLLL
jgi:hypothetical protein